MTAPRFSFTLHATDGKARTGTIAMQRGGQAADAIPVGDQVGEEVPQDRAVAVPIDVGDEGFHGLAAGVVALDQLDADEASGKGRQGDVGTDPVHGGHAGSAGLRLD
mgnify:CR=1 FL=1